MQPAPQTPATEACSTREALLAAAARVFVRRGFHGATIREIAEEAGFTNPVLYYHFAGKEGLYHEVIRGAFEQLEALIVAGMDGADAPLERLRGIARAYLRFARLDPVLLRVLFQELFRPDEDSPDPGFARMRAWTSGQIVRALGDLAATGQVTISDPELAVRIFNALLRGLMVEQAQDPGGSARVDEGLADTVLEVFVGGLRALAAASPSTAASEKTS